MHCERSKRKKAIAIACWVASAVILLGVALWLLWRYNLGWFGAGRTYSNADFGIETWVSGRDYDRDGSDDTLEILKGAKQDAENHPKYDGSYVEGGFPAENKGVCTDVIWRAFREAGYDLRELVDADIAARPEAYPWVEVRDKNIDFRRVANLQEYFDAHAQKLTNDWRELAEWQPGDIVILDQGTHIGIVSDKRNAQGRPYIIHNAGQPMREEDYLKRGSVTAHYRFIGLDE